MTLCMQGNYLRIRNYKGAEASTSRSWVWAGQLSDNARLNKEMQSGQHLGQISDMRNARAVS
jgi:hypothetical protein